MGRGDDAEFIRKFGERYDIWQESS